MLKDMYFTTPYYLLVKSCVLQSNLSQPSWAGAGSSVELESTGKVGCQGVWDDEMHDKAESQPGAAEAGNWNCIRIVGKTGFP